MAVPCFGGRATPRAVNQTDRHLETMMEFFPEEVSDCCEVCGFVRCRDNPASFEIRERFGGSVMLHTEHANLGIVRLSECFGGANRICQRPFHVRLTRA